MQSRHNLERILLSECNYEPRPPNNPRIGPESGFEYCENALSSNMKMHTMQHWFINEKGKSCRAGFSVFIFVEFTESRFVDEGKSLRAFVTFF